MIYKFVIPRITLVSLILVLVLSFVSPFAVMAAAGDETIAGRITAIPTFECIGVTVGYTGDNNRNNSAVLEYRASDGAWKTAPQMYADRTNRQYRGSIFWLTADTQYEIKVTFTDADGGGSVSTTTTTRNDNPPIGTNYIFVATNGNDSTGDGTIGKPYRTIQKGANMASPGSSVQIRAGTYNEEVTIPNSGNEGAWITFMPYNNENVTVTGNGTRNYCIYATGRAYIQIDGINFRDTLKPGIEIENSHDVTIENCTFYNCKTSTTPPFDADHGSITFSRSAEGPDMYNFLIQNCTIEMATGIKRTGSGIELFRIKYGVTIRNNLIFSNDYSMKDGINTFPESEDEGSAPFLESCDIYNNVFYGCDDDGFQLEGGDKNMRIWGNNVSASGSSGGDTIGIATCPVVVGPCYVFRNTVWMHTDKYSTGTKMGKESYGRLYYYHNTFYLVGGSGDTGKNGLSQTNSGLGNIVARNNIIYSSRYIIETYSGSDPAYPSDFDYDFLYTTDTGTPRFVKWNGEGYRTLVAFQTIGQELHGISVADVGFTDPANGDLTLQSDSPAINTGVILPGFNDANSPWPYTGSAPDIGAYESVPLAPAPPVLASIGNRTTHPGWQFQFTISATDANGDTLTYSANNIPSGSSFNPATRTFSWTPSANQIGSYPNVRFAVTDGTFTDTEAITITVAPNQAPVLTNPGNKSVNEGAALAFTLSVTNPDGDSLTYSASNMPSGASINPTTGAFSWTPSYSQAGTYANVRFTVTDSVLSDSENIAITVKNVNRAPVLGSIGNKTVTAGQSLQFTISATDPDGDSLTYSASNLPAGSIFNGTSRSFSWTTASGQVGSYPNIQFRVSDGAITASKNITITVVAIPSNPTPPSGGDGGGGGGSGGGSGGAAGITSLRGSTTINGLMVEDVSATDINLKVELRIPKGTIVKNRLGQPLTSIRITPQAESQAANSGSGIIGQSFEIEPGGATFEAQAFLIFKYSSSDIPADVPVDNLYIALWDPVALTWTDLGGTIDTGARTITVPVQHLSTYALMAHTRPACFEFTEFAVSPGEVAPGEAVTASIVVNNQGDLTGTYEVSLNLDSATVQTKNVTLNGGSSETVSFTIVPDAIGEHQVSIGDMLATFVVKKPLSPAAFTVNELTVNPLLADSGENVDVSVLVKNTGDLSGTYQAILAVDDIAIETKEITLDGAGSLTISFSFTSDTVGQHKVSIGGLVEPFEVKSPPPLLPPPATDIVSGPEIDSFSTAPGFNPATNKLVYARIVYKMNQAWESLGETRLMLSVFRDGQFVEQLPLLTLSQLQADGKTGELDYIPPAGWQIGEYTFRAELYQGENLIQGTSFQHLTVTSESTTVVIWKALGIVIGAVLALSTIIMILVLHFRRDMLRDYWK